VDGPADRRVPGECFVFAHASRNMARMTARVVATLLLLGAVAARKQSGPAVKPPAMGSVVEWSSSDPSYLPGVEIVGIIEPGSSSHRMIDAKTRRFITPTGKSGIRWRVKKPSRFSLRSKKPFKMRIVKYDPRAVIAETAAEGRIAYRSDEKTNAAMVILLKPTPWWKSPSRPAVRR